MLLCKLSNVLEAVSILWQNLIIQKFGACAYSVYQTLSLPPLEGPVITGSKIVAECEATYNLVMHVCTECSWPARSQRENGLVKVRITSS